MDTDNLLDWVKSLTVMYGEVDEFNTDECGDMLAWVDGQHVGTWDARHCDGQVWDIQDEAWDV